MAVSKNRSDISNQWTNNLLNLHFSLWNFYDDFLYKKNIKQGSWMCSLLWLSVESNEKKIFLLILVFESPQLFTVEKPNRYWINRDVWIMYTGSSYDCCWMNKCARFNNTRNITNIFLNSTRTLTEHATKKKKNFK